MLMRRVSAKDKIPNGLVRAALVSGVAVGLAAASLGGVPNADATCIGISGINIGDGCHSTVGSFALVLGTGGTATTGGFLNAAIAVGNGDIHAIAGRGGLDSLNLALNFGNATDGATSTVTAGGGTALLPDNFNLAANLGGNANTGGGNGFSNLDVSATNGFGNVALNAIGSNRNTIHAGDGFLNFAVNVGGSGGRGSDSRVTATDSLSAAFQSQTVLGDTCVDASNPGCGNVVTANGPLSLVVAAGVVGKEVVQDGPGITLANSFNSDTFPNQPLPTANVLAARNANSFAPTTFADGSSNGSGGGQLSESLTKSSKQFSSSLKKLSAGVKNALGGSGKKKQNSEPKPDADS